MPTSRGHYSPILYFEFVIHYYILGSATFGNIKFDQSRERRLYINKLLNHLTYHQMVSKKIRFSLYLLQPMILSVFSHLGLLIVMYL